MNISHEARELLDHMEFVGGDVVLTPCPEVRELFSKNYLGVDFQKTFVTSGGGCFSPWVYITRQGIAVAKGLH